MSAPEGGHAESRDPMPPKTSNDTAGSSLYKRRPASGATEQVRLMIEARRL